MKHLEMFSNRLARMSKHWKKWARRRGITCFRIYDRDIPQVPISIDLYEDYCQVSEYLNSYPLSEEEREEERVAVRNSILEILQLPPEKLFWKRREPKKGNQQYEKLGSEEFFIQVKEGGLTFQVNLSDYLDTGLFLDHRTTRDLFRKEAAGKKVLNLYSYTGSFSVYAASGGAKKVTSVDLSQKYLDWSEENFRLNGFDPDDHEFLREDIGEWLKRERTNPDRTKYDLIMVDPPTFSNSKKMRDIFDVQRDYPFLLNSIFKDFSEPGAVLFFSTNFRKFKIDPAELLWEDIIDLTKQTHPEDFRSEKIRSVWKMRK
ncbi:SAM-dependent methyltransferase [Leptospira langatensis]|uniref:SAM-dependent methyltransferase n=1 Tax=Leptospira langatensis TaxID=2484983 RepID=A0A5F1ZUN0_9LEPT|nr:class I SAM-dependent methyltransferase [Leptospira langatensis]TGJ98800.1 SAM-dependent methyltransferase [Leptospira langatensis]TGL40633.1 SAM-dependent methyltransferase [Leptospira langatensis]